MAADTPGVRHGENLFCRNVRVAGNAIFCGRGSALPFVTIGKADREIGTRADIMKRAKLLPVQPFGSLAKPGICDFPMLRQRRPCRPAMLQKWRRRAWSRRHPRCRREKPASPRTHWDRL